jgi:hypothetical protein
MLLNLSNHPSGSWSAAQTDVAKKLYGCVKDEPFPHINPSATSEEVENLAKKYLDKIKTDSEVKVVHLMGEMTFVVALVKLLQRRKIPVVSSTTERIVLEEKDGKKTMQFQFCQFRNYP